MIVLDLPSYSDVRSGNYLSGADGVAFDRLISMAGISRSAMIITSVFPQATPSGSINWLYNPDGTMRTGTPLMGHMIRLAGEIEEYDPHVIVAMGPCAFNMLTGKGKWDKKRTDGEVNGFKGLTDWRGSIVEGYGVGCDRKVIPMLPIEAIQSQWKLHVIWVNDMIRVIEQAAFPEIRRHPRRLIIDPPTDELEVLIERMLADPTPISFDIEHYHGKLLCIGYCNSEEYALTISNRSSNHHDYHRRILESGHALAAHNAMFDCGVLEWCDNITTFQHLTYDTILAAHAANIELPKDLGMLCSIYTEEPCYWDKSDWKGLDSGKWSFDDMLIYNCKDAFVTHLIREEQLKHDLIDPKVLATFNFELSLLTPLWDISKFGVKWSFEQVAVVRAEAEAQLAIAQQALDMMFPVFDGLNVASAPQVSKLLYDMLGVPEGLGVLGPSTRSTNDIVLARIATNDAYRSTPIANVISLIRSARKQRSMISKFCGDGREVDGISIDDDGRFRSTYVPSATDTGRLSAKKFFPTGKGANAQNQHRAKPVRKCFIPDEGHVLAYNDLERAESLVVAKITGDRLMLEHHAPGKNAHRLLGAILYDRDPLELDDDQYYLSKQTRHAGNYMQGWKTFMNNVNKKAEETGIYMRESEARRLINLYREMHTGLAKWWKATEYQVKQTRTLTNLFGRTRTFYGRIEAELPAAVAYVPQSTVGDCMNYGILNLWNAGIMPNKIQGLMQIHDALVYQFPYTDDEQMMQLLREVRRHMLITIRNPLDGEDFIINTMPAISHVSWGDCKELSAAQLGL